MSDFTTLALQYNSATSNIDTAPTWTGTPLAFGGSGGANELRFAQSGSGAAGTLSFIEWPFIVRPLSGNAVPVNQLWAFTADSGSHNGGVGAQIAAYDGGNTHHLQARWAWSPDGTFAAAPQFSAFSDATHATPQPGNQAPSGQVGTGWPIINGQAADTNSTSYLKANAYGYGVDTAGAQQTPGTDAPAVAATDAPSGGPAYTTVSAAWFSPNWVDLQGWAYAYIVDGVVPNWTSHAGTALTYFWYLVLSLWIGPNLFTGTLTPVLTFQYAYS